MINDKTKPFARMGRKAYRVSTRQPGCRNIKNFGNPAFYDQFVPSIGPAFKAFLKEEISGVYHGDTVFHKTRIKE